MAYLFVNHTVNNFDQWKTVYDSVAAPRNQHGFIASRILRGTDNQNQVVVLEEYQTLEGAKNWVQSSELRVAMGHAGVNNTPDIAFLENLA
jgi:heme-degrading monooxygenase HmoA